MNFPNLEGPITAITLPFQLDAVPRGVDGEAAVKVGEAENGAIIFSRQHVNKRGKYTQRFTLLHLNRSVSIVELSEQNEPVEDKDVDPETPETVVDAVVDAVEDDGGADLLDIDFTSDAAHDLAVEYELTAADFKGKGSGVGGRFTVRDVKDRVPEEED